MSNIQIDRLVLETGPMSEEEARHLAELVAQQLGPAIGAFGRASGAGRAGRSTVSSSGAAGAGAGSGGGGAGGGTGVAGAGRDVTASVRTTTGEAPVRLAARIAEAAVVAVLEQVAR